MDDVPSGAGTPAIDATDDRDARSRRRAKLGRAPKTELVAMLRRGVRSRDGIVTQTDSAVPLGKWRKDELVTAILNAEFKRH